MSWKRINKIFEPTGEFSWSKSHAQVPVPVYLKELDVLRVFFSTRDLNSRTHTSFVDLSAKDPSKILYVHDKPVMELGEIGAFDDCGVMASCVIKVKNELWMYYIGWNKATSVPFRNSIGLAVSKDNGLTFSKYSEGPILDRSIHDICFVASNCVIKEKNFYRMYYLSCNKWEYVDGKLCHYYNIKYAESIDAINWFREGKVCIDFKHKGEYAISAPRIIKENGMYKMWYSFRGNDEVKTYRIGYSESVNGIDWIRNDEKVLLNTSPKGSWDSDMLCYPFLIDYSDKRYMLYNGNDYGKSGIGLAMLDK